MVDSTAAARLFRERRTRAIRLSGPVRLQTLVLVRWLAIVGQLITILFVHYGLNFPLPLAPALLTVGASIALNLSLFAIYPASTRLTDAGAAVYLAFDLLQVGALLYLTGGLENPFSLLLLVPVTISATVLSLRSTLWLVGAGIVTVTLLLFWRLPLPWDEETRPLLPGLYVSAVWGATVLGMVFIAYHAFRVAEEARRMQDALDTTRAVLARGQQLAALGGLAAAAAHELGTPLGTISLVAKELSREAQPGSAEAEDLRLLVEQAQRCKDILANFARRPDAERGGQAFEAPPFAALVEAAAEPHMHRGKVVRISMPEGREQPTVPKLPEIMHALGNVVENAVDFARQRVDIRLDWTDTRIVVEVLDDGPGFNAEILSLLGDPYVTSRPEDDGMGLGVFIAKTLTENVGGVIELSNRQEGGARVALGWPRAILERYGNSPQPRLETSHV